MKLLIWYNLNHHYYYTIYKQIHTPHKVGEINKFNHLLIQEINLTSPKPKLNEKTADKLEKLAERIRYGKVKKSNIHKPHTTKYQWWLKK